MKVGAVYIAISYGEPKNRLLHFYRNHLKFEVEHHKLNRTDEQSSSESVHWIYICRKMENADEMDKFWE